MGRIHEIQAVVEGIIEYAQNHNASPKRRCPLPKYKQAKGDDEHLLLFVSDSQLGHKSKTFTFEVFRDRMSKLVADVTAYTKMRRSKHKIDELTLCLGGDILHGESIGFQVSINELEGPIRVQIYDNALPAYTSMITSMLKLFKKVNVRCVRGNHGRVGKFNADTTSWDDVIYEHLKTWFREEPRIEFHIAEQFYQIFDINTRKFMLTHGDNIKMQMNIPSYGIIQKLMRWQSSIGHFDTLLLGHFHTFCSMHWNTLDFIINGTFVTDDEWVAKVIGMSGSCMQTLLVVSEDGHVADIHKIILTKGE